MKIGNLLKMTKHIVWSMVFLSIFSSKALAMSLHPVLTQELNDLNIYHQSIDRAKTEEALLKRPVGSFLVRDSSIQGKMVISYLVEEKKFIASEEDFIEEIESQIEGGGVVSDLRFVPIRGEGLIGVIRVKVLHQLLDVSIDGKKIAFAGTSNFCTPYRLISSFPNIFSDFVLATELSK